MNSQGRKLAWGFPKRKTALWLQKLLLLAGLAMINLNSKFLKGNSGVFSSQDILKVLKKARWTKKTHLHSSLRPWDKGLWSFSSYHWWRHWGQKAIFSYKSLYKWLCSTLIFIGCNRNVMLQTSILIHFSSRNPKMMVILCQNLNIT